MLHIHWQNQRLQISRLVFRRESGSSFDGILDSLAARFRLQVADERAEPHPGDFWIGCLPRAGWGHVDTSLIGWASLLEVPLAVGLLRQSNPIPIVSKPSIHRLNAPSDEPYTVVNS